MSDFLKELYNNFSVIPVKENKSPMFAGWNFNLTEKFDYNELVKHAQKYGIVCGFEDLEVIDVDNHFSDADELFKFIYNNFDLDRFPIIKTQGGGYHIYYKCKTIDGNQKLAMRLNAKSKKETLVETRGRGGMVVCPPSTGYEVIQGDIFSVPYISVNERKTLLSICKALDECAKKDTEVTTSKSTNFESSSIGTKYNQDFQTVQETISLLTKHGWSTKDNKHFKRPGKDTDGISATFGKVGENKFYVFSSNADPFEMETSYSMWGVLTMLEFGGDYSASAKFLHQKYGSGPITTTATNKPTAKKDDKPAAPQTTASKVKWDILYQIIQDWKLEFRFNVLTKINEYRKGDSEWTQIGLLPNDIIREMETERGVKSISMTKVSEMLMSTDIANPYNPIEDFFVKLPKWDGNDSIKKICKYITPEFGENVEYFESMLRKAIIRTIRCALEREYINRMVFCFYSEAQEIGKTKFFKWLCPNEVYDDETIDPTNKDSMLKLGRYLMINMDELDSLQKKDISRLKAFISKGDMNTRVAYGRFEENFQRYASLFGSTNKQDLLADETNTRWIILRVANFDWKNYTKDVDPMQIWSQCYELYKADNEAGELTSNEKRMREQRNGSLFVETTQEFEIIEKYFENGSDFYTSTDIKLMIERELAPIKINYTQLTRELHRKFGNPPLSQNGEKKVGRYYRLFSRLEKHENRPFWGDERAVETF